MKKPRKSNLKKDLKETKKIRTMLKKSKSIKITINIDASSLSKIKELSKETGTPYQRLLNNLLKESLDGKSTLEARVDQLDNEIKKLKKLIAA